MTDQTDDIIIDNNSSTSSTGVGLKIRRNFLAGLLVVGPVTLTLWLVWGFVSLIDNRVERLIPPTYNPETYLPFPLPGLGMLIVFIFLTLIGSLAAGVLGRFFVRTSERVLDRVPIVRSIYGASKQIAESVLAQQSKTFREVVLVEYPRKGMWVIGFISARTKGEVQHKTKGNSLSVFVPTTPNPTSGFLLFVPETDMVKLDMTVEQGIKMVVSSGIVVPPYAAPKKTSRKKASKTKTTKKTPVKKSTAPKKKSSKK